ncbi:MAG TPA: response regulator transcription factor [Chloroflexota bacterium]|nr:response regulator transcription factor [Chloroflexota bacterium]
MHILVVEDEQRLARLLQRVLTEERHTAEVALTGSEGLYLAQTGTFDLIVLDRMLPDMDGVEICRQVRTAGVSTPVLMLTARGAVEDRVDGLNAGADDYLVKPFAMTELLARINARLRRDRPAQVTTALTVDDLTLDLVRHEVKRGDRKIELTQKEFALLEYLMRNAGMALTRTQILDQVWQYDSDAVSNVVDIYVHYLRDKIDRGSDRPLIKTVRGVGYKLEAA